MGLTKQAKTTHFIKAVCEDCGAVASERESVTVNGALRAAMMKANFTVDLNDKGQLVCYCPTCNPKHL